MLARTKLSGELQLADGAVGNARAQLVLAERAQGKNGVALTAAVLAQRLVLRLPHFHASHASFEWQGRPAATGPVSAVVEVHVTGLADAAPAIAVKLHHLCVRQVRIGGMNES